MHTRRNVKQPLSSGYLQFDDFKAFVVLLGSLGVDPKHYPQYQRMRLGKLFEYLDVDGDRRIGSSFLLLPTE
ncbi:hypothetical protein Efla_000279 [Eimeria flavescens]